MFYCTSRYAREAKSRSSSSCKQLNFVCTTVRFPHISEHCLFIASSIITLIRDINHTSDNNILKSEGRISIHAQGILLRYNLILITKKEV